ncbi:MAG: hypothetical protein V3S32_05930 [Acidimicrobiia bacterium]
MRRLSAVTLTLFTLALAPTSVGAQQQANPIDVIIDAFNAPEGQEFTARFLDQPTPGTSTVTDPPGDFVHSSGQTPGFTPDHIDIVNTWTLNLDPGPIDLFTATDQSQFWAPTGSFHVEPPGYEPLDTFTGDEVHDGSQYQDGAILFGFTLAATPPVKVEGRCEYVVWVHDLSRGPTFVNHPSFPGDPAGDTNIAFGLGIDPEGQGLSSTFALELNSKSGGFSPNLETDVRSFITPNYVGVTVPRNQIDELAGVNFYTFCAEEGFGFDVEDTGADQTGLIEVSFEDLGTLVIEQQAVATTSTTMATTTTTETTGTDEPPPVTTTPEPVLVDDEGFPWWLVMFGGLGAAFVGYWLFVAKDGPGPGQ